MLLFPFTGKFSLREVVLVVQGHTAADWWSEASDS